MGLSRGAITKRAGASRVSVAVVTRTVWARAGRRGRDAILHQLLVPETANLVDGHAGDRRTVASLAAGEEPRSPIGEHALDLAARIRSGQLGPSHRREKEWT